MPLGPPPPLDSYLEDYRQEQFDIVTRPRAHRQCFGWLCRRGGMRLRAYCLDGGGGRAGCGNSCWQSSAEAFMEEQEQQRHLDPLGSEAVGVTGAITFEQSVPLELAQGVAQLVEPVISIGEAEGGKNGLVDFLGGPATDMSTAVQEKRA